MSTTIERRIRRTVLGAILITFFVTVAAVMVANENLERSLLELDFKMERELVLDNARPNEILVWDAKVLKAYYAPPGTEIDDRLPAIFHGLPVPFSGELLIGENTYLITTGLVRNGTFFLAKDITLFESREATFHQILLGLGIGVILLGIILSRVTGKRLVAPLQQLTTRIGQTAPAPQMNRLSVDYKDSELRAIAQSFNLFLGELEMYVKREQSLMGLASHELRTPIAVIAGALDVIERRGGMDGPDKAPLLRMRRATYEMAANIEVILMLTRKKTAVEKRASIDLNALLEEIHADLSRNIEDIDKRLDAVITGTPAIKEDPALVKMLLRNLLQNALQHTAGKVTVHITDQCIDISDEGQGLPEAYMRYLSDPHADAGELLSLSGFGLFIVTLICERLAWPIQVVPSQTAGTRIRISFDPARHA